MLGAGSEQGSLCCLEKKAKRIYPNKTSGFTATCLLPGYSKDTGPSQAAQVALTHPYTIPSDVATALLTDPRISALPMQFLLLQPSQLSLGWALCKAPSACTELQPIHPDHSTTLPGVPVQIPRSCSTQPEPQGFVAAPSGSPSALPGGWHALQGRTEWPQPAVTHQGPRGSGSMTHISQGHCLPSPVPS